MTSHIAYPDELLDDSKLNEFYEDVSTAAAASHSRRLNTHESFDTEPTDTNDVVADAMSVGLPSNDSRGKTAVR